MIPNIEAVDVELSYATQSDPVLALRGACLRLFPGEMVCLMGASGSGKSSLLNVLSGLDTPQKGRILFDGQDVTDQPSEAWTSLRLTRIGMVFQEHNLVPQFTAKENINLILKAQRCSAKGEAERLLQLVGIRELADRRPADMSGGQRQRVGIARALAGNRSTILCDEPTGALDSATSRTLFMMLSELTRVRSVGVLVATHDPIGRDFADRVLNIVDGRIVRC